MTSTKLDQFETNGLQQLSSLSILVSTINPSLPLEDPRISSVIVQDEVVTNPHEDMSWRLGLSSWISVTPAHIQHGSSTRSILAIDKISKDKLSPTCVFSKKMLLSTTILGLCYMLDSPHLNLERECNINVKIGEEVFPGHHLQTLQKKLFLALLALSFKLSSFSLSFLGFSHSLYLQRTLSILRLPIIRHGSITFYDWAGPRRGVSRLRYSHAKGQREDNHNFCYCCSHRQFGDKDFIGV